MITADQIRVARDLLRWTSPTLAKRARVSFATILKAQTEEGLPTVSRTDLWAIRDALKRGGVEFATESDGGVGVKLRKVEL